ncbi:hypothetical protein F2P45_15845 [Massilia sp. CCM 8733]|uniref:Bacteriocin n=1 Tax=Massilia mucilaginosa TaxID=2609282 RepID=A0ABX0NUY3_9BURK|nr:hypothetical protein [Massilia mucilaginosa]NHZ90480.1 hypothetical protein [Massilia mucilaginosa]
MQELSASEIDVVGGAYKASAAAFGAGAGIGAAAFGAGWGTLAVGAAFALSPLAVVAIVGCAGYGGWRLMTAN